MKQISNQALMMFLVASISVSILGTLTNLNILDQFSASPSVTGFASSGTGRINVTVASVTSLTVFDSALDFGDCSPNASVGAYVASNDSTTSWGAPGVCTVGGTAPTNTDSLNISNDGNTDINVTVRTNAIASTFIGGTKAQFMFMTTNTSGRPGCRIANFSSTMFNDTDSNLTGLQQRWLNFSDITTEYPVCANLTFPDATDEVAMFVRLFLPSDVGFGTGERNVTLTFTASDLP